MNVSLLVSLKAKFVLSITQARNVDIIESLDRGSGVRFIRLQNLSNDDKSLGCSQPVVNLQQL